MLRMFENMFTRFHTIHKRDRQTDLIVIAGLQRIIHTLNKTSNDYGMKISIKKTKVMTVCTRT